MRARYAREIRAGINSMHIPYIVADCERHEHFLLLDFKRYRFDLAEARRFEGRKLFQRAQARTVGRSITRREPCLAAR